jgi:chemotaxis protein CheY-P-specific phosphatase CheC
MSKPTSPSQNEIKNSKVTNLSSLSEEKLKEIEQSAASLSADAFEKLISSSLSLRSVEAKYYKHPHVNKAHELAKDLLAHYQLHDFIIKVEFVVGTTQKLGKVIAYCPLDQAKELVDLLLKRPIGTTKDLDGDKERSALKETLNIVGNSFLTSIANINNDTFQSKPPVLIGSSGIDLVINDLLNSTEESDYIYFKNVLQVTKLAIQMSIFIAIPSEKSRD